MKWKVRISLLALQSFLKPDVLNQQVKQKHEEPDAHGTGELNNITFPYASKEIYCVLHKSVLT